MWICTFRPLRWIVLVIGLLSAWLYIAFSSLGSKADIIQIRTDIFADTLLIQDAEIDDIYLHIIFPYGEAVNPFAEGLAHYLEHLAWESAFADVSENKERHSNAWTNIFSTGYWQRADKGDLKTVLDNLIALSKPLNVDTDFALEERKILLREYDYRIAERPLYPVYRDMDVSVYGNGTLARSVIGEPSEIAAYSLEDVQQLHSLSHVLSKATLLVYGNVKQSELKAAISALPNKQESLPFKDSGSKNWVVAGVTNDKSAVSVPNQHEDVFLYRKLIPLVSCDELALCLMRTLIANDALVSALPGGLAGPMQYEKFVARDFSFQISHIGKAYAEIDFQAYPDSGVSLEELEHSFQETLRETLVNGLPKDTFERITARIKSDLNSISEHDRPSYNLDLALDLLSSAQPVFSLADELDALERIRLEDVNYFLNSLLSGGREVTRYVSAQR